MGGGSVLSMASKLDVVIMTGVAFTAGLVTCGTAFERTSVEVVAGVTIAMGLAAANKR